MSIRAKFKVDYVTDFGTKRSIKLSAVGCDGENKSWSKWTPAGTLELIVTNPDAILKPGVEYFLDIHEAPSKVEAKA